MPSAFGPGTGEQRVCAQGDGTFVCTGVPAWELRRDLDTVAGVESRGAATVWRLTEASLSSAYAAAASSYLVAKDEVALADAVRALRGLQLTAVAPTVAVSSATPEVLAKALAKAGLAAGGERGTARPKGRRGAGREPVLVADEPDVEAVARSLHGADQPRQSPARPCRDAAPAVSAREILLR